MKGSPGIEQNTHVAPRVPELKKRRNKLKTKHQEDVASHLPPMEDTWKVMEYYLLGSREQDRCQGTRKPPKIPPASQVEGDTLAKAEIQVTPVEKHGEYTPTNTQRVKKRMRGTSSDNVTLPQVYLHVDG